MEDVKIGVFLSNCNKQLLDILDFSALLKYVQSIPDVVVAAQNAEYVQEAGIQTIADAVKSKKLTHVVVSACDAITSMIRIRKALKDVGMNPYCVEVLNLREHCAWPHRTDPQGATEKAKAMLLAAVDKMKLQEPIETLEFPINQSALIIGGGIAGIQSAIDLTDLGFQVDLIEQEPTLGGIAAKAGRFFPTDDCALCVQSPSCDLGGITNTSRKCLYRSGFSEIPNLNIYTNSRVTGIEGNPGDYQVTVERGQASSSSIVEYYPPIYSLSESAVAEEGTETITLNPGSIIIATGFEEFDISAVKEYNYGVYPDVVTQLELAEMLDPFGPTNGVLLRPSDKKEAKNIVMVQCAGSRDKRYNAYCSSICCMIGLKHALMIKERIPDADVKMCYIDIRSWGREHEENYYEKAREAGVKFVKGRPTEVMRDPATGSLVVDTEDALLGEFLSLEADLVVLSTAFVPSAGTQELADLVGLDLGEDGFFKEYNAKLRPTETKLRGIYICGGATFPKDAPTTSLHASSAALKAAKFMTAGKYVKDATTAVIDSELCGDCEFCPVMCPYGAIRLIEDDVHIVATVDDVKCDSCGICVGTCPKNAITLQGLTEDQMMAQITALLQHAPDNGSVLAFSCAECGFTAIDTAGMAPAEYPANVRILKVPCTGTLKVHHFLSALKNGADAVMVVGCKPDGCHYEVGSSTAKRRVDLTKKILDLYGLGSGRLEMFHNISIEGKDFVAEANAMLKQAQALGSI
jgi:heterodisulfide reductase subunit A